MISNFFKKSGVFVGVAAVLVAAFFYFKVNLPISGAKAQLIINFDGVKGRVFEGPITADMTILQALYSSSLDGKFDVRYVLQKDGAVALARIDGMINLSNKSWHFYLNKKLINTADINKIKIKAGDLIEAKYE